VTFELSGHAARTGCTRVSSAGDSPVSIIGAGIAGAWQACCSRSRSRRDPARASDAAMTESTATGRGMLAPWCEAETRSGHHRSRPLADLWREISANRSPARCRSACARPRRSSALPGSHRHTRLDAGFGDLDPRWTAALRWLFTREGIRAARCCRTACAHRCRRRADQVQQRRGYEFSTAS